MYFLADVRRRLVVFSSDSRDLVQLELDKRQKDKSYNPRFNTFQIIEADTEEEVVEDMENSSWGNF